MKSFRMAGIVCRTGLRKWAANYRIWCIAVLLLILVHMFSKSVVAFSEQLGIPMTPWIFPFFFTQKYIKLLFLFPLVLLFCDAPFMDSNEPYTLIRSGRRPWAVGRIFYIVVSSGIYFLFLFAASILLNLPHMQYSDEWGKVFGTLAKTGVSTMTGAEPAISVSQKIVEYFAPIQAVAFSLLLCWLAGIFIGLLIYFVNTAAKNTLLGILSASAFLILDASIEGHTEVYYFSPVTWCTLTRIRIDEKVIQPGISYVLAAFAVIFILLVLLILLSNRKKAIDVLPPV